MLTIKYEDVYVSSLDLTLHTFKRYPYVLHNSPTFWDDLTYSLPQRKLGNPDRWAPIAEENDHNPHVGDHQPLINHDV